MIIRLRHYLDTHPAVIWLLILSLALLIRLWAINLMPVGLSHDDELNDLLYAKSLALTGSHAPGRVAGILTQNDNCPGNCIYGELVPYLLVPWMWVAPLSLWLSKIPLIFAAVGAIFALGILFKNLSGNRQVGYLAALMMTINPWAIHFGRLAYENSFTYLFYLGMLAVFTLPKLRLKSLILAATLGFLASLTYFGAKPIYLPLLLWGLIYARVVSHYRSLSKIMMVGGIGIVVFGLYLVILSQSHAGVRFHQLGTTTNTELNQLVNQQRQISLDIPLVRDLLINKYTVQAREISEKYFQPLAPNYLFVDGEPVNDHYQISNHAYMYLLDLPFIIFGLIAAGAIPAVAILILGLIGIILLPGAISMNGNTVYAFRTGLLYPILSGLAGWGIYWFYRTVKQLTKQRLLHLLLALAIIIGYLLSFAYFEVMYFYRTPFDKNSGAYFHKRALTKYLNLSDPQQPIEIITAQPFDTFNTYVFFSNIYNTPDQIRAVNAKFAQRDFRWGQVSFTNDCRKISDATNSATTVIVEQGTNCLPELSPSRKIDNTRDGGQMYSIANDHTCQNQPLQRFPYPRRLTDFLVEPMSLAQFCQTWISQPD